LLLLLPGAGGERRGGEDIVAEDFIVGARRCGAGLAVFEVFDNVD
jgi:hypothetical protein